MPVIITEGAASAKGFGFGASGGNPTRPVSLNLTYNGVANTSGTPTHTGTIQSLAITQTGRYTITLIGGCGGVRNSTGYSSTGRSVTVSVSLLSGQTLWILPGNRGGCSTSNAWGGGGGGGSFIAVGSSYSTATCIGAAGGGGGTHSRGTDSTTNGQPVTSNGAGHITDITCCNRYGKAGTCGNGGCGCAGPGASGSGAGGNAAGFIGNGTGFTYGANGFSFRNGGTGGYKSGCCAGGSGGFGGGGSGDNCGGGTGAGYSGGGNCWNRGTGGGGGSYVISSFNGYSVTYTDNGNVVNGSGTTGGYGSVYIA
jgi:hypothetical protein